MSYSKSRDVRNINGNKVLLCALNTRIVAKILKHTSLAVARFVLFTNQPKIMFSTAYALKLRTQQKVFSSCRK